MQGVLALILMSLALTVVQGKPNILVMLIDDVSCVEFEYCGGNTSTPNMNRLSRDGTSFTNAWSSPICQPSRAMTMTGDYAYVTNWWEQRRVGEGFSGNLAPYGTFSQKAQQAGYKTLMVGKWQLLGDTKEHGFDEYCLWRHSDIESLESQFRRYNGTVWGDPIQGNPDQARYWEPLITKNDVLLEVTNSSFSMFVFLDCIKDFVHRMKSQNQPFLIYYPETMAHQDYNPETQQQDWIPMPILNSQGEIIGRDNTFSVGQMVHFMDYVISQMIAFMEGEGVWNNTVALFMGDNGTQGKGKGSTTGEGGVWVPFIAVGPDIQPGRITKALIGLTDVYATVLDFMEIPKPTNKPNSASFKPLLTGESEVEPRRWLFSYRGSDRMIRTKNYFLDGEKSFFDCSGCADKSSCCTKIRDVSSDSLYETIDSKLRKLVAILDQNGTYDLQALPSLE